ncbi:hypothetical protein RSAG8_03169, partial [Rhizoctonia solani AG-8 WAC10335]
MKKRKPGPHEIFIPASAVEKLRGGSSSQHWYITPTKCGKLFAHNSQRHKL